MREIYIEKNIYREREREKRDKKREREKERERERQRERAIESDEYLCVFIDSNIYKEIYISICVV
jgi:hypothetical protein